MKKRLIPVLLAMTMVAGSLCGFKFNFSFGGGDSDTEVTPNETMSADTKWINSDIDGAVDESTDVSEKDDFYTAVNKDWMVETKLDEDGNTVYRTLSNCMDITKERLVNIVTEVDDPDADGNVEIDKKDIEHDEDIVTAFAEAAGDWDQRNKEGVEPLKKYMQAIDDIENMDDMTAYLLNEDKQNLYALKLINTYVSQGVTDAKKYYLHVGREPQYSLSYSSYYDGSFDAGTLTQAISKMKKTYGSVMKNLGYSDAEMTDILTKCYKFECRLVDHVGADAYYSTMAPYEKAAKGTTMKELEAMAGDYPLTQIMKAKGYESDHIIVVNPDYVKYIGSIYNEGYLEEMKAYYKVLTVMNSMDLLDRDTYNLANKEEKDEDSDDSTSTNTGDGDKREQEINDDDDILLATVKSYLSGPLDTVYIAKYCRTEEKEDLSDLTDQIIDYYHTMFNEEDWLSDTTKKKAIEKLEAIKCNILYPNEFESYAKIDFGSDTELLDMVADINAAKMSDNAEKIDQEVDRNSWDLDEVSTTDLNCYYMPSTNSINVLAGFISGDTYEIDMSEEEKLGMMGCVIGHEVTHAFDQTGAQYDKYGNQKDWWTLEDKGEFTSRVLAVSNYFSGITPYPGASTYTGSNVSGEATADMGGMKCALGLAKQYKNFDYKKFFESYEHMWAVQDTLETEESLTKEDVHPLMCLRSNVNVMQFDEFYEAYGIKKGDGMYLPKKERIAVW